MNNVQTPFTDLDEQTADNRRFLLRHIEVAARLPTIRLVRQRALEAWGLRDPHRLLDVGSGAGEVVQDLAALVGPAGEAIGVDNSRAAVDFARERADAAAMRYDQGDALALPYPDKPVTVAVTDFAEAAALLSVVDRAVLQGPLLNLGETAEPWLAEVDRAVTDGTLLAVLTIWVVTGTKPLMQQRFPGAERAVSTA